MSEGFEEAEQRYKAARGDVPRDQMSLFDDDTLLVCGVENPESCESCQ